MSDVRWKATHEFGALTAIFASRRFDEEDSLYQPFDEYAFTFEGGRLTVSAQAEDDSISVGSEPLSSGSVEDISQQQPWDSLIGSGLIWSWRLRNQQGYDDGFQVEFHAGAQSTLIQFVCEASSLTVYIVKPLR
jgi:hypothetical protein